MPKLFEVYGYKIYIWSNENMPLEPIHVHISKEPHANATKVWLLRNGKCSLDSNSDRIPKHVLRDIMQIIEFSHKEIENKWLEHFGEIRFKSVINKER